LAAAETACAGGAKVALYEGKASIGRKFLIAGKGGLNLTHSEPKPAFIARYRERAPAVAQWLDPFDADELRAWCAGLGVPTLIGSSGRVFPVDFKAAPLLRAWQRRLRAAGVSFHVQHRWQGWDASGALVFVGADGVTVRRADATVLALGGGSWAKLGSDGAWVEILRARGVEIAPLTPANGGFEIGWSTHLAEGFAGQALKRVRLSFADADGRQHSALGELVIANYGIEGQLVYALSAPLRDTLAARGALPIILDLISAHDLAKLTALIDRPRGSRSIGEHLRRSAGIDAVRVALLAEVLGREGLRRASPSVLAQTLKALPLTVLRTRPLDEAISSAGGVRLEALDAGLMLRGLPGVFIAGEMLDFEAPTGGYLLTAAIASGRVAGASAARWVHERAGALADRDQGAGPAPAASIDR